MSSTLLQSEIEAQPDVIRRLIDAEGDGVAGIAKTLSGGFSRVVIAARGTSDNAARYARYLFGAYNRLDVSLATPSLYTLYRQPPALDGALVVGISQSGRSPDILAVVQEGVRQGQPTLAITNDAASPLASAADYVIDLHAGVERAVAATKTYTASLAALALLSAHLAADEARLRALDGLPARVTATLDANRSLQGAAQRYRYMERCAVLGRGYNYATAFEIALKLKELNRIYADPYSTADFLHGPIAMVREGFPVILIGASGAMLDNVRGVARRLQALDAEIVAITDRPADFDAAQLVMVLPGGLPEHLSPLVAVIPGQMLGLWLAEMRGYDADQPEGLTKVTETW
jgi:glucosamine--fructose-6-phosphate aminotransferase (isomerizing)